MLTELGEQDVVYQSVPVSPHHRHLLEAHGVRPAQTNLAAVEGELSFGRGVLVLPELAHAELARPGIAHASGVVEQGHLQLVKPGRIQVPDAGIGQVEGDAVLADARTGRLRDHRPQLFVQVAVAADIGRGGDHVAVRKQGGREVLAEQRKAERDQLIRQIAVVDLDPGFRAGLGGQRTDIEVADEQPLAGLDPHALVDAHRRRAVMPARLPGRRTLARWPRRACRRRASCYPHHPRYPCRCGHSRPSPAACWFPAWRRR